jgi:hypothetical protein
MQQEPVQEMFPQQTGVKALYGLQQIVMQHVLQHLWQPWQQNHAAACPAVKPSPARLRKAVAISFFMA